MSRYKWIKMPDGKMVKRRPDKIALFLADNEPINSPDIGLHYISHDFAQRSDQRQNYNTDAKDIGKLAGSELTVVGAGSVGSHLSYALGPAGLSINSIDYKKVQLKHTRSARTVYDRTQIGLKKVYALKQKTERDFPGAKINPYPFNVTEIPDAELRTMFARSLAVILAIDDPTQMLRISDLAYPITEIVQVALHTRAESGHIAISIPFVTPCLRCTLDIQDAQEIHRLDGEPANSLDIVTVAQQAARIAVDIIYSKITGRHITRWDTSRNLIYIANTKQKLSPEGPGFRFESSQKLPGCSICNTQ